MPLHKGTSISLPAEHPQQQSLKRKQSVSLSLDDKNNSLQKDLSKNRLMRSNDILLQSSFETILDMIRAYAGIKECTEETQVHLNMVINLINSSVYFNF